MRQRWSSGYGEQTIMVKSTPRGGLTGPPKLKARLVVCGGVWQVEVASVRLRPSTCVTKDNMAVRGLPASFSPLCLLLVQGKTDLHVQTLTDTGLSTVSVPAVDTGDHLDQHVNDFQSTLLCPGGWFYSGGYRRPVGGC